MDSGYLGLLNPDLCDFPKQALKSRFFINKIKLCSRVTAGFWKNQNRYQRTCVKFFRIVIHYKYIDQYDNCLKYL